MRKLLAIVFIGVLAVSCSKKDDNSLQDSNVMLEEPEAKVVDSSAAKATAAPVTDGTAVKTDSAAAK